MPPGESLMQGAVPVYSSIPTLEEVMRSVGFSYDNLDDASFFDALNSALSVSLELLAEWKQDFLERHNWGEVVGNIKSALPAGRCPRTR